MKTFEMLVADHVMGFTGTVAQAFSCMIDILSAALGVFLGYKLFSNHSSLLDRSHRETAIVST